MAGAGFPSPARDCERLMPSNKNSPDMEYFRAR
jgi:hypothetical protein